MNWPSVQLGDIARIQTGKSNREDAVLDGKYMFFDRSTEVRRSDRFLFDTEAVIVPGEGSEFIPRYFVGPFDLHQRVYAITDFRGVNGKFVYYTMYNRRRYFAQVAIGATVKSLRKGMFENFTFDCPPIDTQDRIAFILSTYDDLIENNHRRIKLLERATRLLYKEWFIHLRFPGHEYIKIIGGVPNGWGKKSLSELVNTQYGFTETATGEPIGPKFLRGTDINKTAYIDWSTVPYCPSDKLNFSKYALNVGDILVIRMADPGKVAIVESEVAAVFASYLVRLTKKEDVAIPSLYLFYALSGDKYQGFISGASSGTTRKSASAKLLIDFELLVPSPTILSLFVNQIKPLRSQIQVLLQKSARLRQARDILLPKLMNGEVTV